MAQLELESEMVPCSFPCIRISFPHLRFVSLTISLHLSLNTGMATTSRTSRCQFVEVCQGEMWCCDVWGCRLRVVFFVDCLRFFFLHLFCWCPETFSSSIVNADWKGCDFLHHGHDPFSTFYILARFSDLNLHPASFKDLMQGWKTCVECLRIVQQRHSFSGPELACMQAVSGWDGSSLRASQHWQRRQGFCGSWGAEHG